MAQLLWSQDVFTRGELSPMMYSRITVNAYYNGLKTAKNVIGYPQGAAGKRFGTIYQNQLTGVTDADDIYFKSFQYLNQCVYLILIKSNSIDIYLEGVKVATVSSTGIFADDIQNLDHTVLEDRFRVTTGRLRPKDLTRSANPARTITAVDTSTNILTHGGGAITAGVVLPATFTTTGSLPTSTPQIREKKVYFIKALTSTTFKVFSTAPEAKNETNEFNFTSSGSGTNNLVPQNSWALNNVSFRNFPVFDFSGGYDSINFTPSATSGGGVTLTASSGIFTSNHVGGVFVGNGGIGRIVTFTSTTQVSIDIIQSFNSTSAIPGRISLLAEPAWSDTRGWPRKCSSFQNRAVFANTELITNGLWLSAINDFDDFNDVEDDADDAISWFPTSDEVNYIRFIVPYRSLTIHTNSGVYSTPLSKEVAITPQNFALFIQDSTPATDVQPRGIDNQIIIISGNDVHSLLWDGINNAYSSSIISVPSEHLIDNPIDEAAYTDLNRAGSRYMIIVNQDGTIVIYQTLATEEVSGFTRGTLEQHYGNAYFRKVTTNFDGRGWFVVEREIATADSAITISSVSDDELTATASNFDTDNATACRFTTTGTLPDSEPQITTTDYFWAIGVDANTFKVYTTKEDADNDTNAIVFNDSGSGTNQVEPWSLETQFFIEELSFDVAVDSAETYSGTATSTITGLSRFNAQNVLAKGDGFGFNNQVINSEFDFVAHGESVEVEDAQIGFGIHWQVQPMPMANPVGGSPKSNNVVFPKHIRSVTFMFDNTVGGTVNDIPIALKTFNNVSFGSAPNPANGIFEIGLMKGWEEFKQSSLTLDHTEPFDIRLTGIFYKIEV